jgi:hypothetical protein
MTRANVCRGKGDLTDADWKTTLGPRWVLHFPLSGGEVDYTTLVAVFHIVFRRTVH